MEKKQYTMPLMEVITLSIEVMQNEYAFGVASRPQDPLNAAPKKKTEVF